MISKLRLLSFRAYEKAELEFDPEFNLIVGPNGIGKTSLLEAIAHLGMGRSPWSGRSTDVIREGESFALIQGKGSRRKEDVAVKLKRGGRKEVEVAGKRLGKLSELLGIFPIVAVGPQEIELVKGPPSVRRKLMDYALCQMNSEYTSALGRYKKILSKRNAALRGVNRGDMAGGHILVEAFDENIANYASCIMDLRANFVKRLSSLSADIYREITGAEGGELIIKYKPTIRVENLGPGEIEESYKKHLRARRRRDLELGETGLGPHRDEVLFDKDSAEMDRFGSWGQARAASIAVILAASELLHKDTESDVSLLLDDCFAELDPENTSRFIDMVTRFGQVFLASPRDVDYPEGKNCATFGFEDIGRIKREN